MVKALFVRADFEQDFSYIAGVIKGDGHMKEIISLNSIRYWKTPAAQEHKKRFAEESSKRMRELWGKTK